MNKVFITIFLLFCNILFATNNRAILKKNFQQKDFAVGYLINKTNSFSIKQKFNFYSFNINKDFISIMKNTYPEAH